MLRLFHLMVVILFLAFPSPAAFAGECPAETLGVSVAEWDTALAAFSCRGMGQVFDASDSLISSITVWRPAEEDTSADAWRLFITEVDSTTGVPLTQNVLLVGPELVVLAGDGIHSVRYHYAFDPPFALPGRRLFFFAILAEDFGHANILATRRNLYPNGRAWETGPDLLCIPLGAKPLDPNVDLAFEIVLCSTRATPARHGTWGEVKLRYR